MIMVGKSIPSVVGIAVLLAAMLGEGAFLCFRNQSPSEAAPLGAEKARKVPASVESVRPVRRDAGDQLKEAPVPIRAEREPLADRLKLFRDLVLTANGGGKESATLFLQFTKESGSLRPEVFSHPAEYLAFLRARENESVLGELLNIVFANNRYYVENGMLAHLILGGRRDPGDVPREILDGVLELAKTGSATQKCEALQALPCRDRSERANLPFMELCISLLEDSDPKVAYHSLISLEIGGQELLRQHTDQFARMLESLQQAQGENTGLGIDLGHCLRALASVDTEKSDEILIKTLERALEKNDQRTLGDLKTALCHHDRSLPVEVADRTVVLLTSALRTTSDSGDFRTLLELSLRLPLKSATPILESGVMFAPTPELREGLNEALRKIRQGERGIGTLMRTLESRTGNAEKSP
jgi:hypothetical protein